MVDIGGNRKHGIDDGRTFLLDAGLGFGLETGETKRVFGRSSNDTSKEYILTVWGVSYTSPL